MHLVRHRLSDVRVRLSSTGRPPPVSGCPRIVRPECAQEPRFSQKPLGLPRNPSEPLESTPADRGAHTPAVRCSDGIHTGADMNRTMPLRLLPTTAPRDTATTLTGDQFSRLGDDRFRLLRDLACGWIEPGRLGATARRRQPAWNRWSVYGLRSTHWASTG
jgi:hypothetical protein